MFSRVGSFISDDGSAVLFPPNAGALVAPALAASTPLFGLASGRVDNEPTVDDVGAAP